MTTLSALPPWASPMTFIVGTASVVVSMPIRTRASPACARPCSSSPSAKLVVTTGMLTGSLSVP